MYGHGRDEDLPAQGRRAPVHGQAVRGPAGPVAARDPEPHGCRDPSSRPARGLSRRQERALRAHPPYGAAMKHRLGFGVLVLTVASGYAISGFAGAPEPRPAESAPLTAVDIDAFIATAAARYRVSEELIAASIEAESEFNPRAGSRRGAQGRRQHMPETSSTPGVSAP